MSLLLVELYCIPAQNKQSFATIFVYLGFKYTYSELVVIVIVSMTGELSEESKNPVVFASTCPTLNIFL
jgi:hypothetical protein